MYRRSEGRANVPTVRPRATTEIDAVTSTLPYLPIGKWDIDQVGIDTEESKAWKWRGSSRRMFE